MRPESAEMRRLLEILMRWAIAKLKGFVEVMVGQMLVKLVSTCSVQDLAEERKEGIGQVRSERK